MLALNSLRELRNRPLRALLATAGVAVTTAMLADMLMLGRGITGSFGELLESRGYELRLTPRGTLPFDSEATIVGYSTLADTVAATPGVERIAPVLGASVALVAGTLDHDETRTEVLALGMRPDDRSLFSLTDGAMPEPGQLLADTSVISALGVRLGDPVTIRPATGGAAWGRQSRALVSGSGDFIFAARGERQILLPLSDLQALTDQDDRISFAMIRIAEGFDPESVRAALVERTDRVEFVTLAGVAERMRERLSYFRQMALVLGSVSLVVATLLAGTIASVSIGERLGLIAALRAVGVSRRRIVGGLVAEMCVLCVAGASVGVGLAVVVAGGLETILSDFPGLPLAVRFFVVGADSLAGAFALVVAAGAAAASVPALHATRMEVTAMFRMDQP